MSLIGTYRLINAIENGSYTSTTLNTALGTARTKSEFASAINDRSYLQKLMNSEVAVPVILGSALARGVLFSANINVLTQILPNSEVFLTNVMGTASYWQDFEKVEGMYDALVKSDVAMKLISAETTNAFHRFRHQFSPLTLDDTGVVVEMDQNATTGTTCLVNANGIVLVRRQYDKAFKRATLPSTTSFKSIAYGVSGYWVAVGNAVSGVNTLYYSNDDAVNWTAVTNPVNQNMSKVIEVFSNRFVAIGAGGSIVTAASASMGTWSNPASGVAQDLNDVIVSGGTIVAVGNAGVITSSTTGTTWTARTSGITSNLLSVSADGTGKFLAVGASTGTLNSTFSSNAAVGWTAGAIIGASVSLLSTVKTSTGDWYVNASGSNTTFAAHSTNGTTWTTMTYSSSITVNKLTAGRNMVLMPVQGQGYLMGGKENTPFLNQVKNAGELFPSTSTTMKTFILPDGIYHSFQHTNLGVGVVYASNIRKP